jgi:mercuric ion binding protein
MIRNVAIAALMLAVSSLTVHAADKTVVLNVDNANCELCAPIVKKTLQRVPGVKTTNVVPASATSPVVATVTFDDAVTNVQALVSATTNAGYPSHQDELRTASAEARFSAAKIMLPDIEPWVPNVGTMTSLSVAGVPRAAQSGTRAGSSRWSPTLTPTRFSALQ